MPNRLILPLLCAASLAFARGSFAHDEQPVDPKLLSEVKSGPIESKFAVTVSKDGSNKVLLALHVTNNTKKMVELLFPNGQTHEFVVTDAAGKEVWRWSEGRMFTSAMRNKVLGGKGETVYEEKWNAKGLHGAFTATAKLRSNNFPVETSVEFVLP